MDFSASNLPEASSGADGPRRISASHLVRQCRQPAAGARLCAAERNRRPSRDWLRTRPDIASTPDRKHAVVITGLSIWDRVGLGFEPVYGEYDFGGARPNHLRFDA